MTLADGTQLGPYEIIAPLGAGGMGEVYRARDTRLDREVAIKVLPEQLAKDRAALARFEREAKAVAALSHPNILAIHDVGTEGETSYVVMELLEGETLRECVRRSALPWRKAVEYGVAIADGLAAAHAKGIVHRDLKPENIFLTKDGVVKILDFGLARVGAAVGDTSREAQADTPTMTLDTRPGTVLGTVNYMSPEQISGRATDVRTDIFSFGCVLYEMISGQRAFRGESIAETTTAILRDEPPTLSDSGQTVPAELDRVITRCHEKKPEQRFQSSGDLAFTLRSILADSGLSKPTIADRGPRMRTMLGVQVAVGIVAAVALLLTLNVGGWRERLFGPASPGRIDSLAVLPLENLSGDPDQEYFADGMTDALITNLSKIGALKVISRTSAMQYKGTNKPLPEIARELNVRGVVEGSVLVVSNSVRITAQLIEAATDRHLWAESYERDMGDILTLQGEIARAIASEIRVKLTRQERTHLATARQVDPEAYDAYLKGRYFWNKRTSKAMKRGLEYFEQAIQQDPGCALCYAGLADTYLVLAQWEVLRPDDGFPQAKAAATAALQIDERLAEAHAALAVVAENYERDWSMAESEFEAAIRLNPGYATAHQWYAEYFAEMGRHEEAIAEMERAQALDPLSLIINANRGFLRFFARDYDQAIVHCQETLDLDPDFAPAHLYLGWAYERKGMYEEAIAELLKAGSLGIARGLSLTHLGHAYAVAGRKRQTREVLGEAIELSKREFVSPHGIALIYTALGEKDEAFLWLEKAYEQRDTWLIYMNVNPNLDTLRSDPRFDDLLRRIGLQPSARRDVESSDE